MILGRKTGLVVLTCLCVFVTSVAGVDAAKKKGGKKGAKKRKTPLVFVLEGQVVTDELTYWFRPEKKQHKMDSIWDMELDKKQFCKLLKEKKASDPSFPYESLKQSVDKPIALKLQGVTFKDKKKTMKTNGSKILGMAISKKELE